MAGFDLNVTQSAGWAMGKNKSGIEHPSRDTSAKVVMFTVVNGNTSSVVVRAGVDNLEPTTDAQRQLSFYFQKFNYSSAILAASPLEYFNGVNKGKELVFKAAFYAGSNLSSVLLEKAGSNNLFEPLMNLPITENKEVHFADNNTSSDNVYYRLKITTIDGKVMYSIVLPFMLKENKKGCFNVYPSVVNSSLTVSVASEHIENANFQLVDLSGRTVYQQSIRLQNGTNSLPVQLPANIKNGQYVAVVKTSNKVYTQQIVKL